ncbi:MAG: DUF3040 domain-containing protein [Microbacteriaceae bacterium]|nr:DUF3040 domain-containing protein [Microbacteriaceae bacterium]
MPLSEHEQRLLEEMERNLYHNDADFVATVGNNRGKPNYTLIVIGILGAVLGVGVTVFGIILRQPGIGIVGFIIMFAGALVAIAPARGSGIPREPSADERASAPSRSGSRSGQTGFMDRINERWEKRQDGQDDRS